MHSRDRGDRWLTIARELRRRLLTLLAVTAVVSSVIAVLAVAGIFSDGTGDIVAAKVVETPDSPAKPGGLSVEAKVGSLAPNFEFSDFDGDRHQLSDFRGRPVYLNFWATWCGPCREELPDMQELLERHGDADGLAVIALNRGEPLSRAQSFLKGISRLDGGKGVTFTVNGLDPDSTVFRAYRGVGMPTSVFIDKDGVVRFVWTGLLRLSEMEAALQETIEASSAS